MENMKRKNFNMNKIMKNLTIVGIIFAFAFAGFITGQQAFAYSPDELY